VDSLLTRGYCGKFCGYILSENTPIIMVCPPETWVDGDCVFVSYGWGDGRVFYVDMEEDPRTGGFVDTLVGPPKNGADGEVRCVGRRSTAIYCALRSCKVGSWSCYGAELFGTCGRISV
jgi:hypothetical protein